MDYEWMQLKFFCFFFKFLYEWGLGVYPLKVFICRVFTLFGQTCGSLT